MKRMRMIAERIAKKEGWVEVSMKLVKLAEELIATEEQFNRSIL
jgi:hypothetical protein